MSWRSQGVFQLAASLACRLSAVPIGPFIDSLDLLLFTWWICECWMSVEELLDLLLFRAWLSHLNSFWAPGFGPPPRRPKLSFTSACRCLSQPKKVEDRWFRCERNASHFCLVKFDPVCGYHSASHCPYNCENPLSSRSGFLFLIFPGSRNQ